jgi:spore coat polysaccharide biosynthesis protein SpsF
MKIVTIVQTRIGSSRLPGKVLKDLGGATVLARVVHRLRRAALAGEIVIATTHDRADDVIVEECQRLSVASFRGEEKDVLDRYYRAARSFGADAIVRITSDCPLIEPETTDKVIRAFLDRRPDYASNALDRTYPRGLDTEIMTVETLDRTWAEARAPYQRSHVTAYIYENPDKFDIVRVTGDANYSDYRWTLDTPEDLEFIRAVYERMGNDPDFYWRDVLALLEREPELVELNSHIRQKALQEG